MALVKSIKIMGNKLIKKCQYGTPRGGLVPRQYSGTWGNRGQGNELQSAVENGLSWVGDKFINAGDYIDDGLAYLVGLLPGGLTPKESIANTKLAREANEGEIYYDVNGNTQIKPVTLKAPLLPTLPAGASPTLKGIHDKMRKLVQSWKVGERRYAALGRPDAMDNSKTAHRYNQFLKAFNEGIANTGNKVSKTDNIKVSDKVEASIKSGKAMSTSVGGRAWNGRPATVKYKRAIEEAIYNDKTPYGQKMWDALRLKRAKIIDKKALKLAEDKILREYAIRRNMEHQLKQLGWIK